MSSRNEGIALDLVVLVFEIAFEGCLVAVSVLLLATFLAFARMNKDVRRARLFIMADRVKRFLGAFTLGFLAIAAESIFSVTGLTPPAAVSGIVILVFLASIVFGSLELFLIVRPRRSPLASSRKAVVPRGGPLPRGAASAEDPSEGESHAAR